MLVGRDGPGARGEKELQASVTDLQVCLTQERHRKEDLEVMVLALEKEKQLLEVES